MAMSMDAILNIKANVTGEGALNKLASGLGSVQSAAGKAGGGLKGLAGSAGGLLGSLAPLAGLLSVGGLVAMGKAAINAGDNMNDMAQKTGVSVENLSKFQQAAKMSGGSIEGVQTGLLRLSKAMMGAAGTTDTLGKKLVDRTADALRAVEKGETDQTRAVERNTDQRIRAIDRETGRKLSSIELKYRKEEQRLRDIIDGTSKAEIEKRTKEEAAFAAIDARRQAEIDQVKAAAEAKTQIVKDSSTQQLDAIKELTAATKEALKKDPAADGLADQMDELGLSGKGASQAFTTLGINIKDSSGKLKATDDVMLEIADKFKAMPDGVQKATLAMALFGKSGADMIPMLNMGRDSIESLAATMSGNFAKQADALNDKTEQISAKFLVLGVEIGTRLLPAFSAIANEILWLGSKFAEMPGWLQGTIVAVGFLAGAFVLLLPAISAAVSIIATVAPVIVTITAAITSLGGIVSVIGMIGTALAAIVGWPLLIVAGIIAAVALIFTFREQIAGFFTWMADLFMKGLAQLGQLGYTLLLEPWVKMWNLLKAPVVGVFNYVVGVVKGALNQLVAFWGNVVNGVINIANNVIRGLNRLPRVNITLIPNVQVPRFAKGGFVTGPTLAMLGDNAGGREYAVPEGKAVGFANNILAGRRGASAIPSGASGGAAAGGAVTVNITTGPVMQDASGQQWMTVEDGQKMAGQIIRQLRTPAGRYATGVR